MVGVGVGVGGGIPVTQCLSPHQMRHPYVTDFCVPLFVYETCTDPLPQSTVLCPYVIEKLLILTTEIINQKLPVM